ncbi:isochorismatase hydrolase [Fusarium albosuccineum]|uniref:Isochorismatase hydrolase n=1 Tax=Fusarium albosuccineum TaxID=1237068 RepID=A0A8H4LHS4_9HYPO|nr:isochorismatase hydrolase [Fusarium albosuccineum]
MDGVPYFTGTDADLVLDPKTEIPDAARIRDAGTSILAAARGIANGSGGESPLIVFVQHEESAKDGPLVRGTGPWELVFEPQVDNDNEITVSKNTRDTFKSNPSLAEKLTAQGIKHIAAFGIQSECCVLETCKGALAAGFRVTLLQGAHSTYDAKDKTALQIEKEVEDELEGLGASIVPSETAVPRWKETGKLE